MKRIFTALLPVIAVAAITVVAAAADLSSSASLPATKATFVVTGTLKPCANWGHYYVFHVGANASSVRRGLLHFDLSSIPANAEITSAKLSVYETITLRGSGVVGAHRVTTPWAEGTGANTCTNDGATWELATPDTPWLSPGGDYSATGESTVTKRAGDAPGWDTFDLTSLVRGWANGTYPNDGVLLKLDDESPSPCTTVTNCNYWPYASNDYSDSSLRPILTVTYG